MPTPSLSASKEHLQALIAVSQSLASTTHPKALRYLGRIADHLLNSADSLGAGMMGVNKHELSPLEKRILTKCAGQTLNSRAIAMACRKAPGGSSIKRAIKLLVLKGKIEKSGAAQYQIPASAENS